MASDCGQEELLPRGLVEVLRRILLGEEEKKDKEKEDETVQPRKQPQQRRIVQSCLAAPSGATSSVDRSVARGGVGRCFLTVR
jgi:hypothetical protein